MKNQKPFFRHSAKLLVLLFAFALIVLPVTLTQAQSPPNQNSDSLQQIFSQSATEFNVPVDLLVAMAWVRSHIRNQISETGDYGIMQLPTENPNQVAQASQLLGETQVSIKYNNQQNVLGAAALLRQVANEKYPGLSALSAEQWFNVTAAFSYPDTPQMGQDHAQQIFTVLSTGLTTQVGNETLVVNRWSDAGRLSSQPRVTIASDDYAPAHWVAAHASNYTDATRDNDQIDMIVIHTTEGNYSAAVNWFTQPNKYSSAHYFIRSADGDATQMVLDEDVAWHAGDWNTNLRSIGIEHEAFVNDSSWYTEAMYRASARLVKHLAQKYNIPLNRQHIIGHVEVPGCPYSGGGASCHTDPGSHWDWDYFMSLLVTQTPTPTPAPTLIPTPSPTATTVPNENISSLVGLIYNAETSERLVGAQVSANGQTVLTNRNGVYRFNGLSAGEVSVTAEYAGFESATKTARIESNTTRWNSMWLSPQTNVDTPVPTPTATNTPAPMPTATQTPLPPLTNTPTATPTPVSAEETGTLVGLIRDADTNARLADVTVTVLDRLYVTDERGYYRFDNLPAGVQQVSAQKEGYSVEQRTAQVVANELLWNSIYLRKTEQSVSVAK